MFFKGKIVFVIGFMLGIGLGYVKVFVIEGVNVMINGFGDVVEIEKECVGFEVLLGGKVLYLDVDMIKFDVIVVMVKICVD